MFYPNRPWRRQGLIKRGEDLAASNIDQYRTYLHVRVPRVECPGGCTVRQVQVSWARPRSEFTLYCEVLIILRAQDMPVKAIAELVGEHDTRTWRILDRYLGEARSRISPRSGAWA